MITPFNHTLAAERWICSDYLGPLLGFIGDEFAELAGLDSSRYQSARNAELKDDCAFLCHAKSCQANRVRFVHRTPSLYLAGFDRIRLQVHAVGKSEALLSP
jgi:hypothetical protein